MLDPALVFALEPTMREVYGDRGFRKIIAPYKSDRPAKLVQIMSFIVSNNLDIPANDIKYTRGTWHY